MENKSDYLKNMREIADENEKIAEEFRKIVEKKEDEAVIIQAGGLSEAGQTPTKPKELTPGEYKDKIMSGEIPK